MIKKYPVILLLLFPALLFSNILMFYSDKKAEISTIEQEGWIYVSITELEQIFDVSIIEDKSERSLLLKFPEQSLKFISLNPYYLCGTQAKKMFLPFIYVEEKPYISLSDIENVLCNATGKEVFHLHKLGSIVVDSKTFNPDSIIFNTEDDKITFTLTSDSELLTSIDDSEKGRLKVTLFNAVCKPTIIPPTDGGSAIKKILLKQEKDEAVLSFYYDEGRIETIDRELARQGPSIRITFHKKKVKPSVQKKPEKPRIIHKIIIDPGHGGRDPGAVGPSGLTEKEIVLLISKELSKILKKQGFDVSMTRDDDSFVKLRERSRMANNSSAHLFVSIHCNASGVNRKATGFETFFLSTAKTSWARAVEAKENSVIEFETSEESESILDYILWDLAQNEFLRESSDLADYIQEGLGNNTDIVNRGVKQANFYVMREIYMPSVLVEAAFISNCEEEKMLKKSGFRKKIARGIAEGIVQFKKRYEKKLNQ
jgi:N-acetylmuramoyl-L-alanine amidase